MFCNVLAFIWPSRSSFLQTLHFNFAGQCDFPFIYLMKYSFLFSLLYVVGSGKDVGHRQGVLFAACKTAQDIDKHSRTGTRKYYVSYSAL